MEMIGWGAGLEDGNRDHLIIFVSGFLNPTSKNFHFQSFADRFDQTKLFLRDSSANQFRDGIQDVTTNETENLQFLDYMINKIGPSRVSIVSGSVGTHPAVLWGHLLGVDDMYLLGPVTDMESIMTSKRSEHPTFMDLAATARRMLKTDYPYLNVRNFMIEHSDAVKSVDIYYSAADEIDAQQAAVISDLPQVRSTVYHSGDHFRVPAFALRRDNDIYDRLYAPTIESPSALRRQGPVPDVDLGYAVERIVM